MVLALIWGSSFILIKKGLQVYDPGEVAGIRILAASFFLLPWAITNIKKVNKGNLKYLFFIGMAGSFIPAFLFAKAQTKIDSSLAGVLNALTPFFVLMIGAIYFGQLIYRRQSIGLTIGFIGTVVLVMAGSGGLAENINLHARSTRRCADRAGGGSSPSPRHRGSRAMAISRPTPPRSTASSA